MNEEEEMDLAILMGYTFAIWNSNHIDMCRKGMLVFRILYRNFVWLFFSYSELAIKNSDIV